MARIEMYKTPYRLGMTKEQAMARASQVGTDTIAAELAQQEFATQTNPFSSQVREISQTVPTWGVYQTVRTAVVAERKKFIYGTAAAVVIGAVAYKMFKGKK